MTCIKHIWKTYTLRIAASMASVATSKIFVSYRCSPSLLAPGEIMMPRGLAAQGLAAWMPSTEETNEFYKCRCGTPGERTCYSPHHRFGK